MDDSHEVQEERARQSTLKFLHGEISRLQQELNEHKIRLNGLEASTPDSAAHKSSTNIFGL